MHDLPSRHTDSPSNREGRGVKESSKSSVLWRNIALVKGSCIAGLTNASPTDRKSPQVVQMNTIVFPFNRADNSYKVVYCGDLCSLFHASILGM
jgi:hypothetical protein